MAEGIADKVAIIGMGCSVFGERWDSGPEQLMLEAFNEAVTDAGIERDAIEAAWLGVFFQEQNTGKSALPLSQALRLPNIPVTRVAALDTTVVDRGSRTAGVIDFVTVMSRTIAPEDTVTDRRARLDVVSYPTTIIRLVTAKGTTGDCRE